jgi:hypothetical protein
MTAPQVEQTAAERSVSVLFGQDGDMIRALSNGARTGRAMHVAMLAPPWISVPPPGYGGVEWVVSGLTEALVSRGHMVTLFCAPGSRSSATVVTLLDEHHPDEIERSLHEADHVARAFDQIELAPPGRRFDVVHDHCGFTALAMADRLDTPLVHTLHGPFTPSTSAFYARHGYKAALVGISRAQLASTAAPAGLDTVGAIPNPVDVRSWPFREQKDDYLLWVGRMTAEKGPHRAIAAAHMAGRPLVMAGVIQPGQQAFFDREVAPHVDGERAACELVVDGRTGFLVDDEVAMAAAVGRLGTIAPQDCRAWVAEHCDVDAVAVAYEQVYRLVVERSAAVAAHV